MERIGFFGGCFNPPSNIHIKIADNLIKQGKLDKVIFIPVNDYYKKPDLAESKHRLNMLKLAVKHHPRLEVNDIEIKENRPLFAKDAFEIIYNNINGEGKEVYFLMGSDNYNKMPNWIDYDKIKDKYNFIVIDRDAKDISSTEIREMIKNGNEKVMEYLPKEIYNYIIENELYFK